MPAGTLLYAQSGGVTAVINATASAVIQAARAKKVRVLAARNGILGALREDLIDASKMPMAEVRALAHTPGGAFGSCRVKLKSLEADRAKYERLLAVLKAGAEGEKSLARLAEMGFALSMDHVQTLALDFVKLKRIGFSHLKVRAETLVEGINTNIPLHRELMVDAKFMAGGTNIHYLEEWLSHHKR